MKFFKVLFCASGSFLLASCSTFLNEANPVNISSIGSKTPMPSYVSHSADDNLIFFDYNQSTLRPSEIKKLKKFSTFLHKTPAQKIALRGYVDNIELNNKVLASSRVKAVEEFLVKSGIKSDRIVINMNPNPAQDPRELGCVLAKKNDSVCTANRRVELTYS